MSCRWATRSEFGDTQKYALERKVCILFNCPSSPSTVVGFRQEDGQQSDTFRDSNLYVHLPKYDTHKLHAAPLSARKLAAEFTNLEQL